MDIQFFNYKLENSSVVPEFSIQSSSRGSSSLTAAKGHFCPLCPNRRSGVCLPHHSWLHNTLSDNHAFACSLLLWTHWGSLERLGVGLLPARCVHDPRFHDWPLSCSISNYTATKYPTISYLDLFILFQAFVCFLIVDISRQIVKLLPSTVSFWRSSDCSFTFFRPCTAK